jgi:hypothetical protein
LAYWKLAFGSWHFGSRHFGSWHFGSRHCNMAPFFVLCRRD